MALELYKPDEATKSRGGIAVLLAAMMLYGVVSLYEYLSWGMWLKDLSAGMMGDEFPITPRVLISMSLTILLAFVIYMLCNHRKVVEFLISTEAEMQKVSWPPRHEVISSSIVVVVTVVILAIYLGAVDYGIVLFKDKPEWNRLWSWMFGG